MSLSEWIILEPASGNFSSLWQGTKYKPGLNRNGNAAHIVVYDRYKQILEEEVISPLVMLAIRNMYQTPLGMVMKSTGMYRHLKVRSKFLISPVLGRLLVDLESLLAGGPVLQPCLP